MSVTGTCSDSMFCGKHRFGPSTCTVTDGTVSVEIGGRRKTDTMCVLYHRRERRDGLSKWLLYSFLDGFFVCLLVFETGSYAAQADLQFTLQPRMSLSSDPPASTS